MNEPPVPPLNNAPPIPLPSGDVCPVCRAALQDRPKLCPNCGAVLAQVSAGTSCWVAFLSITLSLLALVFGGVGACFLMFASSAGFGTNVSSYAIVAVCFMLALACGWAVFALNHKKK